jgi:mono/diheme cytochrome c family protein
MVMALAVVAAACGGTPSEDSLGAELYDVSCSRCHVDRLEGGIGPALDGGSRSAIELSDQQIADSIRVGPGAMPGFGRLSDAQVESLVEFLREHHGGS